MLPAESVLAERAGIAQDDQFHACTRDCHVHTPQVGKESYLAPGIAPHERNEDDIAFLTLKAVHRIHTDKMKEGLEKGTRLNELAQMLHLDTIGRYDTHVDPFVQDTLLSDLQEIGFYLIVVYNML